MTTMMNVAKALASKSEDPKTKVGCIIILDGNVVGMGYNRLIHSDFTWEDKHPYVIHAEVDAIHNAYQQGHSDLSKAELYTTLFPCNECAKLIVMTGIKSVYYDSGEKMHKDYSTQAMDIFVSTLTNVYKSKPL